jgi:hypothetical protein
MYQLTDANLKQIAAWFHQDVPCKNGVNLLDLIKSLSAENVIADSTVEAPEDIAVAESTPIDEVKIDE